MRYAHVHMRYIWRMCMRYAHVHNRHCIPEHDIRTYVYPENRSPIQCLALMRSAINCIGLKSMFIMEMSFPWVLIDPVATPAKVIVKPRRPTQDSQQPGPSHWSASSTYMYVNVVPV